MRLVIPDSRPVRPVVFIVLHTPQPYVFIMVLTEYDKFIPQKLLASVVVPLSALRSGFFNVSDD